MVRLASVALLVLVAAAAASAQDIVDNPAPKNGDVCKDAGDQWRNITLGPCETGTYCQAYKRGVYKCVSDNKAMGALPIGAICYDENKVDGEKDKPKAEQNRKFYREQNCVFDGVDRQGTPNVQCVQTKEDKKIYKCGRIMPLDAPGCYTVAGSMIWGKWNDNQMYDACNGCPCTPQEKMGPKGCKSGPCKYPVCRCEEACDAARKAVKCATS
ncbi:hypothetical protein Rsub_05843 [Raphidocelis subcapitata]|uniref:Uncharacterized protein n=1 Tax=Raphidocelis subcapitata TaxID=307507 RepID=A0A2V0NZR0_9CHLO|nr:hypothetical protein Rsub_05843 [Raphidocelis subcapitata]|eukprot:GBF93114.1 hypothetical protein Rsub_05843 [Raphidocelis subcapitata]